MSLVMRDVRNVGKDGFNDHQKYKFRGVDDFIGALAQPLRDHGVFMMTEILDYEVSVRGKANATHMRVAFHFYGPAGDKVTATTLGEASDHADKASNKAMSAALKYALMQTFMIPVDAGSLDDGDRDHPVGQRSPADNYMERIRKPVVWNNVSALAAMHAEAKADGLLGAEVQGPDGSTTLGELLVARGTYLRGEAAKQEEAKAQEAPQVAAQVAAETGTPRTSEPAQGNVEPEAPEKPNRDAHVQRLMAQVADPNCWSNPLALSQIKKDAEKHQVLNEQVQGPPPGREWMAFRTLLDNRFAELNAANTERNAA
ncbi:ERF family protein [Streptomyces scopuliridis]|uniref:ERF family protein n=1 Tax=Streptomyces scopuliridis TaxID=452529 RepID=UPI003418A45C